MAFVFSFFSSFHSKNRSTASAASSRPPPPTATDAKSQSPNQSISQTNNAWNKNNVSWDSNPSPSAQTIPWGDDSWDTSSTSKPSSVPSPTTNQPAPPQQTVQNPTSSVQTTKPPPGVIPGRLSYANVAKCLYFSFTFLYVSF